MAVMLSPCFLKSWIKTISLNPIIPPPYHWGIRPVNRGAGNFRIHEVRKYSPDLNPIEWPSPSSRRTCAASAPAP